MHRKTAYQAGAVEVEAQRLRYWEDAVVKTRTVTLLCSSKDARHCHRTILSPLLETSAGSGVGRSESRRSHRNQKGRPGPGCGRPGDIAQTVSVIPLQSKCPASSRH